MRTDALDALSPGLSDDEWAVADRLLLAASRAGLAGVTPSVAARAAGVDTDTARGLLDHLARRDMLHTTGNGSRTRYHQPRED